jgi:TonB-dependent siderophore receptor
MIRRHQSSQKLQPGGTNMTMNKPSKTARRSWALIGTALAGCLAAQPALAAGQPQASASRATQEQAFDVPAGPLATALLQLGTQAGVQFNIDSRLTEGRSTAGLRGRYSVEQALATLLAGTGLTYRFTGPQTIVIEALPDVGDARMLGAVRVEGATMNGRGGAIGPSDVNGINGSNDVTATEGTGSFTTGGTSVASKEPRALKDTPQSVSVITSAQLEEQNLNSFPDLMAQMPGVSVVTGAAGAIRQEFYSRGLRVQRAQIDGGAQIDISNSAQALNPQFDMGIYDHAEILRGADGLFNGYGDPGGVISLQRKRPLDRRQALVEGQVGSWNNFRASVDITGPIALDGRVRARGVAVWQDREFFYDTANTRKGLLFGSVDFDATDTTLLNVGASQTWLRGNNFAVGLPRYTDGGDIGLPRDTCLCLPDSRFSIVTNELFARFEQAIGKSWNLRANVTRLEQKTRSLTGNISGAVIRETGTGPLLLHVRSQTASTQFTADVTLNGSFRMFGQDQRLVVGGNYSNADGGGAASFSAIGLQRIPVDVLNFNPADPRYRRTATFFPTAFTPVDLNRQLGAYATLDLTVWSPLHVAVGLRYSKRKTRTVNDFRCVQATGCTNESGQPVAQGQTELLDEVSNTTEDFVWPPNVSARLDITKNLTAYGSYTRIFGDQSILLDAQRNPLPPFTGNNVEAGVKWAPNGGRTNLSLSVYRIKQQRIGIFSTFDPTFPFGGSTVCCYVTAPDFYRLSEGVDAEVTGEIVPGLQVAASYTYNRNENRGTALFNDGLPLQSRFPAHIYKVWLSYQPRRQDWLGRLNVGAGVNGQSSTFVRGLVCPQTNPVTGFCQVRQQGFQFVEPPYAIVAARIGYTFNDRLSAAININNMFDKKYYQTVGVPGSGNYYGEPRNVLFSLNAKY